jgi:hypothetical protein
MVKKRIANLAFLFVFFIVTSLLSSINGINKDTPSAYAQTNSAMFATLASSNNSDYNIITTSAAASSATANTITSAASNTTAGLQIKRGANYFDSSSSYLVYPSPTSGMKLPAVIMIHQW